MGARKSFFPMLQCRAIRCVCLSLCVQTVTTVGNVEVSRHRIIILLLYNEAQKSIISKNTTASLHNIGGTTSLLWTLHHILHSHASDLCCQVVVCGTPCNPHTIHTLLTYHIKHQIPCWCRFQYCGGVGGVACDIGYVGVQYVWAWDTLGLRSGGR